MRDTIKIKIGGGAEMEKHLEKGYENKEVIITLIGEIPDTGKKSLHNGEFMYEYKFKTQSILDLKVGGNKIEIKPQKGSWAQEKRQEIISFWKHQIRDVSEKTHNDVYLDFCKWVDSKMLEFYQEQLKKVK